VRDSSRECTVYGFNQSEKESAGSGGNFGLAVAYTVSINRSSIRVSDSIPLRKT
jgi:hypothetical protein